jgi:YegS/Rv2252/BmrU family lipid kinase
MNRSWYVIANPNAGNGQFTHSWEQLQQQIAAQLPVGEFAVTRQTGHAIEISKRAVEQGYRHILAVGGDGTNHEVANGILQQQQVPSTSITQALLPWGTGNDWIKTYQLPRNPAEAIACIARGKTQLQDVGRIHCQREGQPYTRYFVNVAGLAYDAYVVKRGEELGGVSGKLGYLWLVTRCLFEYKLREAVVLVNNQAYQNHFYTINFGIGRYSGGGMQLVPHAQPDRGEFAVTLAGDISRIGVLLNTYRFYNGTIGGHPKVETFFAKSAKVDAAEGAPPTWVEADGEFLGQTPASFEMVPKAWRVIVP